MRTLTVVCKHGLCNRLRVLVSGVALAEASGRQFTMIWPRTYTCSAPFQELFSNDFNVVERNVKSVPEYGDVFRGPPWRDFLAADESDLVVHTWGWLLQPKRYPSHAEVWPRCVEILDSLLPAPYVHEQAEAFRQRYMQGQVIGVHLRRGDFGALYESTANTRAAVAQVSAFVSGCPSARILLCTDDGAPHPDKNTPTEKEGVGQEFRRIFGDRVVSTVPRTLDRRHPEAVQDALVDFLLLRQVDFFVGTAYSSFSEMAAFGRNIPAVRYGIGKGRWVAGLAAAILGGYPVLKCLGAIEYRRNIPYRHLSRHYYLRLRAWMAGHAVQRSRRIWYRIADLWKEHGPRSYAAVRAIMRRIRQSVP